MNIIKFKDIIKPGDDAFNTLLKGKYAFWIQMRYVVPLDMLDSEDYILAEQNPTVLKTISEMVFWDLHESCNAVLDVYIDDTETENINSVAQLRCANNLSTSSDLTISDIKKFRTWLASELLKMDQNDSGMQCFDLFDENFTHVLQYYAGGMYDKVLGWLSEFGIEEPAIKSLKKTTTTKSCSCGNSTDSNLSSLYDTTLSQCDTIEIYRKNIYKAMVDKFSDIDFWAGFTTEFLSIFKSMIDNILCAGLPLTVSDFASDYAECVCISGTCGTGCGCNADRRILENLSSALGLIITDEVSGHRNAIGDAFETWAITLYESMEWN